MYSNVEVQFFSIFSSQNSMLITKAFRLVGPCTAQSLNTSISSISPTESENYSNLKQEEIKEINHAWCNCVGS